MMHLLNEALVPLEQTLIQKFCCPKYPTIFIVGAPRSGATLLSQLLIKFFKLGYISNIAARFWLAPFVGAQLASELGSQTPSIGLESDLGVTPEFEGLHEFGFFWRRWFKYGDTHQLNDEQIKTIDVELLRKELAAVESVFDRPLLFKNASALSLQIRFLSKALPNSVFIHSYRDPVFNAQSLLLSRGQDKEKWFSIKPHEYSWLKRLPYLEQVAGQVYYTLKHVQSALALLDKSRYIRIDYKDLCMRPITQLLQVGRMGVELERRDFVPLGLVSTNKKKISDSEFHQLEVACQRFFGESKK